MTLTVLRRHSDPVSHLTPGMGCITAGGQPTAPAVWSCLVHATPLHPRHPSRNAQAFPSLGLRNTDWGPLESLLDAERGSKIDQELRDVENVLFPRFQKRRLEKAQKKREARAVDRLEQELLKDTVKFGEVVLQPPELTVQPRRSTSRDAPGKKALMLKTLLGPGSAPPAPATSLARQRILGEERERAVQAYRALKKLHRQEVTPAQPPGGSSQRQLQACL